MSPEAPRPRESVQTLDRGLRVLEVLAAPAGASGLTVTELAAHLGVGRTVVYRLLETLGEHDLVGRGVDGKWRLGLGVAALTGALLPRIRASATPILRRLADEVGATAHLTLVEADSAVAAVVVEPTWTDLHVGYRVGTRHALDTGAAGRAILAARSAGAGRDRARTVVSEGELQPGAVGVAAALVGIHLEGSVGVVALHALDVPVVGAAVERAATELADELRGGMGGSLGDGSGGVVGRP